MMSQGNMFRQHVFVLLPEALRKLVAAGPTDSRPIFNRMTAGQEPGCLCANCGITVAELCQCAIASEEEGYPAGVLLCSPRDLAMRAYCEGARGVVLYDGLLCFEQHHAYRGVSREIGTMLYSKISALGGFPVLHRG